MRKERRVSKALAALSLAAAHFFAARFFLLAVSIGLALPMHPGTAAAAIIERFSLRRSGGAVEVDFATRGQSARWQLSNHGQELWIDLPRSQVTESAESGSALLPLTRVSMRDFGAGHVLLIIGVKGKVDYAVAQLRHQLVVRIAPSGQHVDLEQPLLAEMEQRRPSSRNVVTPTPGGEPLNRMGDRTTAYDGRHGVLAKSAEVPNLPAGAVSTAAIGSTQPIAVAPWFQRDSSRRIVVIDAGHGGIDPGAESANGIAEKMVALQIARHLAVVLAASGVDAELTRNEDSFLSLPQRTELANHAAADLFVSIHLNSSPDWRTRGVETYYLNNTTDRATIRLARMENGGDYGALAESNLNYILANLRQDFKAHDSASLARMVEAESTGSIETELGIKVNALGAKMGPFYVLVGAEMPSILIECGFLSNPYEAQLLTQPQYQQALVDGIARAIVHYFNTGAAVGNL